MVHAWVEHIRQYAKEHNLTYPNAMKDPNCKATYKNKKGSAMSNGTKVEGGMLSGVKKRFDQLSGKYPSRETIRTIIQKLQDRKTRDEGIRIFSETYETLSPENRDRFIRNIITDTVKDYITLDSLIKQESEKSSLTTADRRRVKFLNSVRSELFDIIDKDKLGRKSYPSNTKVEEIIAKLQKFDTKFQAMNTFLDWYFTLNEEDREIFKTKIISELDKIKFDPKKSQSQKSDVHKTKTELLRRLNLGRLSSQEQDEQNKKDVQETENILNTIEQTQENYNNIKMSQEDERTIERKREREENQRMMGIEDTRTIERNRVDRIRSIAERNRINIADKSIDELISKLDELGIDEYGNRFAAVAGKGLSKRPRRFAKGSKEAKDYMAALRAKRKKNS